MSKAIAQVEATARALLGKRLTEEDAQALASKLATGTWTHDYPITADEAKRLGLPVSTEMPDEVLGLMTLYPQPVRRMGGGVEYLRGPRLREVPVR